MIQNNNTFKYVYTFYFINIFLQTNMTGNYGIVEDLKEKLSNYKFSCTRFRFSVIDLKKRNIFF